MHLSNSSRRLVRHKKETQPDLWLVLERMRVTLGISHDKWAETLELTSKDYIRYRSARSEPSAHLILKVTERFELSFDGIMSGRVDYKTLLAHESGDFNYLSEYYALGAFSKRRTSINILDYLESFYGWQARVKVLRNFQMTDSVFAEPDAPINIRFLTDLCSYLHSTGFSEDILFTMGAYSVVTNVESELGKTLAQYVTPAGLYERMITGASSHYDLNFTYRLDAWDDHCCVIVAEATPNVRDALKTNTPGSKLVCATKRGVFSSATGYSKLPFSDVREITCVHRGDDVCRYEVNYEAAHELVTRQRASSRMNAAFN